MSKIRAFLSIIVGMGVMSAGAFIVRLAFTGLHQAAEEQSKWYLLAFLGVPLALLWCVGCFGAAAAIISEGTRKP